MDDYHQISPPAQQSLSWWRKITVEPVMVLYMGSFMLNTVLEQAFFVQKACSVDLNLPASICANISAEENKDHYKRVQVEILLQICSTVPIILKMGGPIYIQ